MNRFLPIYLKSSINAIPFLIYLTIEHVPSTYFYDRRGGTDKFSGAYVQVIMYMSYVLMFKFILDQRVQALSSRQECITFIIIIIATSHRNCAPTENEPVSLKLCSRYASFTYIYLQNTCRLLQMYLSTKCLVTGYGRALITP